MAHVATPEVVAPTPAEDDAAAPAIIAPPEDDASNKPKRPRKASFPEKLVQLLQEEPDVIRWTREGTIVIPDPAKLESKLPSSPVGVESTGAALLGKRKAENSRRQFRYHSSGWPSVVAAPDSRPAPVEPLKLPESILPVRFLETPARSDVTLAMDRMLDHVARDTKRPKLAEPEDDKGPTVADLAAYLVSRGGNAAQADGWSVGKNPRGDTIYTDSSSGRVFRSKPEVVRFLNVGQA